MIHSGRISQQKGFTIVELLIVIVIIAILAAITIVAYNGIQNRANTSAVKSDIATNAKKMEIYRTLNSNYPITLTEFRNAQLAFSLNSYQYAVYCGSSTTTSDYGFAFRVIGGSTNISYTPSGGVVDYTGIWDSSSLICGRIGVSSPDITVWLKGNGAWSGWVVY